MLFQNYFKRHILGRMFSFPLYINSFHKKRNHITGLPIPTYLLYYTHLHYIVYVWIGTFYVVWCYSNRADVKNKTENFYFILVLKVRKLLRRKCYYHKRKQYTGVADAMILYKRNNITNIYRPLNVIQNKK